MSAAAATFDPRTLPRRSPVLADLTALGARFARIGRGAQEAGVAETVPGSDNTPAVRLVDLSPLPRAGFKGAATPAWLGRHGLGDLPEPNRARRHGRDGLVVRLAPGEVLLLPDPSADDAPWIADLEAARAGDPDAGLCYPVPRADSHAWLVLDGVRAPETLSRLCGVDLRPHRFPDLSVAQTTVARVTTVVVRADGMGLDAPRYHLLADWATVRDLWRYLLEAMAEFDGGPAGRAVLRERP